MPTNDTISKIFQTVGFMSFINLLVFCTLLIFSAIPRYGVNGYVDVYGILSAIGLPVTLISVPLAGYFQLKADFDKIPNT